MIISEIIAALNFLEQVEPQLNEEQFLNYKNTILRQFDGLNFTHEKIQEIATRRQQR